MINLLINLLKALNNLIIIYYYQYQINNWLINNTNMVNRILEF